MSERVYFLIRAFSLLFVTILLLSNSFFFDLSAIYYAVIFGLVLIHFFLSTNALKSLDSMLVFFLLACLLSIALNNVPSFFQPYSRLFVFAGVVFLLTNIVESKPFNLFRELVFKYLIQFNLWICVLSVVLMVLGIHEGRKIDEYNNLRPDFAGLYRHSMVLSAMCGIATLSVFHFLRVYRTKVLRILLILAAIISFIGLIQSGSRAAIAGFFLAALVYFYILYRNRLHKFLTILFVFVFSIVVTFPLWEKNASFVLSKFETKSSDLQYGSRDIKWTQRMEEFSSSPIMGIGFASVDIHGQDDFNPENGIIEPGTSWLAVLSMTGIIGFLIFLIINYRAVFYLIKNSVNETNVFLLSILILILFYMLFEGIVFASGTLLCACYWLLLGRINIQKNNYSK